MSSVRQLRWASKRSFSNNKSLLVVLAVLQLLLLNVGCSTFRPKDYSKEKSGEWAGKALIKDKRQNKSGIVNLKVRAIDQDRLRIDVTSPLGSHLASVLIAAGETSFLNVEEKTLYKGEAGSDALAKFLKVPLLANDYYNILFDRAFENKNWSCVTDKRDYLKSCEDKKSGMTVNWVLRDGVKRTIALEHSSASVQINLYNYTRDIVEEDKAFTLKVPPAFKTRK